MRAPALHPVITAPDSSAYSLRGETGDGAGSRQEALIHLSRRGGVAVSPAQEQPLWQRWEAPAPPLGWLASRHPSSVIRHPSSGVERALPLSPASELAESKGGGRRGAGTERAPPPGSSWSGTSILRGQSACSCDGPAGGRSLRIPPEPGGSEDLRLVSPHPRPQFPSLPSRWKAVGGSPSFLRALLQQGLADWSRQAASWFWK